MAEPVLDINNNWGIGVDRPLYIAGPCSAESETQIMETAKQLKEQGIHVFRAGIWKPRTRPGNFEGVGAIGLPWLKRVKDELGLPVTTEVASPQHIEEALKNEIDILWIGARTTVSPFVIQDIADALRGVDIPVIVKNPVNPDLALWAGALERLNAVGLKKITALHRGFSTFQKTKYRNLPMWEIPIQLKNNFPELQMICDPSHICGNREGIEAVSQKALDLNFDGLMIETHPNPDKAWSDAKQQITPKRLGEIIEKLKIRDKVPHGSINELESLRNEIDVLDENLLSMLSDRMQIAQKIGAYKGKNNITILQTDRWRGVVNGRIRVGAEKGLSKDFIEHIFDHIHTESIRNQEKMM